MPARKTDASGSNGNGLTLLRKSRLVDQAIEALQTMIESGQYAAGDQLPTETELTKQLGVGRSTVREAIRVLGHLGLVESRQGQGTFVTSAEASARPPLFDELSVSQVLEVHEARHGLELVVARLASSRRTKADIRKMKAALARCRKSLQSGDIGAFVDADMEFHVAAASATHNPVLAAVYETLWRAMHDTLVEVAPLRGDLGEVTSVHSRILAAIERGDAKEAAAATDAHMVSTAARLAAVDRH